MAKARAEFRRQIHQHETRAKLLGRLLDLGEAVHGGGIDAGDELKIEQQEAAVGAVPEQGLDLLIEPVGRAEEQIALQAHALDLVAVRREDFQLLRCAIERGAVLGAVEAELDGIHPARADGEGGAADDHADQHAGDEAPLDDQQRDGEQRDIFEREMRRAEVMSHA